MDEIKSYIDTRYVSTFEAIWRIFKFNMYEEKPHIQRLQVDLLEEDIVAFNDNDNIPELVNNETNKKTLIEWFLTNQSNPRANGFLYIDFPSK